MASTKPPNPWVENFVFNKHRLVAERLGPRKAIFSVKDDGPLLGLYFDSPERQIAWKTKDGKNALESLFSYLEPVVREHPASVLYLTYPDGAFLNFYWEYPMEMEYWNKRLLLNFERYSTEHLEGGPQFLVVMFRAQESVIVFKKLRGFEVFFHGPDSFWQVIRSAIPWTTHPPE